MPGLDQMRRQLEAKVSRVAGIVADQVVRELRSDAPVDSGTLRSLITAQVRTFARGASVTVTSGAEYAQFVDEHRQEWDATMRTLPDLIDRAWRASP